jgi:hypothetical protein
MNEEKFNVTHEMGEQSIEIRAQVTDWGNGEVARGVVLCSEDFEKRIVLVLDLDQAEAIAVDIIKAVASARESQ